jgi:hypothetical protein
VAVARGQLEGLRALRDALAIEIDLALAGEKHVQLGSLARQLRETLREIAELERTAKKGSVIDDLAARRQDRRATTASTDTTNSRR